jgi:hypothetical protein
VVFRPVSRSAKPQSDRLLVVCLCSSPPKMAPNTIKYDHNTRHAFKPIAGALTGSAAEKRRWFPPTFSGLRSASQTA